MNLLNPTTWRFVYYSKINRAPQIPCVYAVVTQVGEVLYVGQTQQLRTRWKAHSINYEIAKIKNVRIAYIEKPFAKSREMLEGILIRRIDPPLNRRGRLGYSNKGINASSLEARELTRRIKRHFSSLNAFGQTLKPRIDGLHVSFVIRGIRKSDSLLTKIIKAVEEVEAIAAIK